MRERQCQVGDLAEAEKAGPLFIGKLLEGCRFWLVHLKSED
jgi:hypothetical protein